MTRKPMTRAEKALIDAAMVRYAELLAQYPGWPKGYMRSAKAVALGKACARLAKERSKGKK